MALAFQAASLVSACPRSRCDSPDISSDTIVSLRRGIDSTISTQLTQPITLMTRGIKWHRSSDHSSNSGGSSVCKHDVGMTFDYIKELVDLVLWPIDSKDWDVSHVILMLGKFRGRRLAQDGLEVGHGYGGKCNACSLNILCHMDQLKRFLMVKTKGLCLDCFTAGVGQGTGTSCRAIH